MEYLRSRTGRILIQGHRGAEAVALENSWESIKAALERGADVIEVDIHRAADGSLVLHNSYKLSDGRWIRDLDAGELRAVQRDGHRLVWLDELLDWAQSNAARLALDIKNGFGFDRRVFAETVQEVIARRLLDRVIILGWDHGALQEIKQQNPQILTCALIRGWPVDMVRSLKQSRIDILSLDADMASTETVQQLHNAGIGVVLGMTHDPDFVLPVTLGVDVISVSDPAVARSALAGNS